jgi:DNA-binding transcriptional MerR regulator
MVEEMLAGLDQLHYIKSERIPDIDLYMDQLTSFMDEHLKKTKRYPEDKALTKTMINNYAKNNLLPPPEKKKYSREHVMLLLFIYYYKSLLSFNDIEQLFRQLTQKHFHTDHPIQLEDIYEEVFSLENSQIEHLKDDVREKFQISETTFTDAPDEDRQYLQLFSLIGELSFDVYMKTKMVEHLIDQLHAEEEATAPGRKKSR